ncbi:MAG: hypothetical protein PHU49_12845 [Syntrophorhabdaceae bacterium]|nr:hypothetical protein [Syntrophorhabdaceae bacterium]MDD5244894.1 hypothetical protein [Syntrophorhabdaceae bacterium]
MEQVEEEVSQWPLDGLLGFLAMLSLEAVHNGQDFFDPRYQGEYLNLAIVDDFPAVLPRVPTMYAPARIPFTEGQHVFIHELNMAQLTHISVLKAREGCVTDFNYDLRRRICRLLLIMNDVFNRKNTPVETIRRSLVERRQFALEWLRYHQFNRFFNSAFSTMAKLARQRILLLKILPKFFKDIEEAFRDATQGVNLQRYFEILTLIVSHVYYEVKPGKHWFQKKSFTSQLKANAEEVELIMRRWIRTPEQYRERWTEWKSSHPSPGFTGFDFVCLRETPLIEGRPDELVCPVLPFLLAKIEDDPFFILSDYLGNPSEFQTAIGEAYQQYAASLVERIGKNDPSGTWSYQPSPTIKGNIELADDFLQRDKTAVCFEHKGGRPGTDFLRGGEGDRLLGPSDIILKKLDRKESVTHREGRNHDEGIITRGMWQQNLHGQELVAWAEGKTGNRSDVVFPIITYLCDVLIDEVVFSVYLDPLMETTKLYTNDFWQKPQWLHIDDLEALAALSEQGSINISELLNEKITKFKNERFDLFLYERFGKKITIDRNLMGEATRLLKDTKVTFWEDIVETEKSL